MSKRTNLLILLGLALALNATAQTEPGASSKKSEKALKRARRNNTDEYKGRVAEQVRFTDDAPKTKKQRKEERKGDVTAAKINRRTKDK